MRIARFIVIVIGGLGLAGCQLMQNLQTVEAEMVRRVLADNCLVGTFHSGAQGSALQVGSLQTESVRMGKVSKLNTYIPFQSVVGMQASRIYIFSIQDLSEAGFQDWAVADAAYEGQRDNLYFNRQSGAFACSTDEWRAVGSDPKNRVFEISPLILAPAPRAQ